MTSSEPQLEKVQNDVIQNIQQAEQLKQQEQQQQQASSADLTAGIDVVSLASDAISLASDVIETVGDALSDIDLSFQSALPAPCLYFVLKFCFKNYPGRRVPLYKRGIQ